MNTPRWMPRSSDLLAAAALGTLGLGLAVLPSFAQEAKRPPSEEPAVPFPDVPGADVPENANRIENGNRIENVAADLTLESVRIESVNLNDTDAEYAVYRFGRVVHEIRDAQAFTLKGFNVDT